MAALNVRVTAAAIDKGRSNFRDSDPVWEEGKGLNKIKKLQDL